MLFVSQFVRSHCNIPGKEDADKLAKQFGRLAQSARDTTYDEAKRFIRRPRQPSGDKASRPSER